MKKIFVSNWISLDGIFSGPNGETEWFTSDEDLYKYNMEDLQQADTIIFGRTTYELMIDYWPTSESQKEYPQAHEYMNACKKHIFSGTIHSSDWSNCFFHKELNPEAIHEIKSGTEKNIVILGSGEISRQMHALGLIDEYHILLDPQFVGAGKVFFQDMPKEKLLLQESKSFDCGVNHLKYKVLK
ncbi:dihydrofolate reductase family protein [Niabella ginsengisoli]|uniref:Dihydrofolate reductase family protein n=1 Tax=Niabella ginsengisoli TaxID=522298 RepID=A0ABS9SJR4_9BACT|nr:dihydrofolate reductase family protein [Niabella ginsengisoli]MCH5598606.1 dihydrofolate reductase family protein [Niabella ginsengisoli]